MTTQKVAIFGVSFKGNINDVRSANSIFVTNYLTYNNIKTNLFDPYVKYQDFYNELKISSENYLEAQNIEDIDKCISYFEDYKECLKGCNTLILCNDHSIFKTTFKLNDLYEIMEKPAYIFDCYDNFPLDVLKSTEFNVFKLGEHSDLNKCKEEDEM